MRNLQAKLSPLFLMICFLACYFSNAQQAFDKLNNGIVVHVRSAAPGSAKTVRLQVINDDILRVNRIPFEDFAKDTSLIIVYKDNNSSQFTTDQNEDTVYLKTKALIAKISMNN